MSTAQEILDTQYDLSVVERRVALAHAIDLADAEQDIDLAFRARKNLISALYGSSRGVEMMAAFGWCLTKHDEDPKRFPLDLWYYKWVASDITSESAISREQAMALLDDVETRFEKEGAAAGPALKLRLTAAREFGDTAEVERLFALWQPLQANRSGILNDCKTCDIAKEVSTLSYLERYEEAVEAGSGFIEEKLWCGSQPQAALAGLLKPLREVGRDEDADRCCERSLERIGDDYDYVRSFGLHVKHYVARDEVKKALALVARTMPHIDPCENDRFWYFSAVEKAIAAAEKAEIAEKDYGFNPKEIAGQVQKLAQAFDLRNGNSYYSDQLA